MWERCPAAITAGKLAKPECGRGTPYSASVAYRLQYSIYLYNYKYDDDDNDDDEAYKYYSFLRY